MTFDHHAASEVHTNGRSPGRLVRRTGCLLFLALAACSEDMDRQPSFQPMEEPRLHSPAGSVPRSSRAVVTVPPADTPGLRRQGAALYAVNCAHCHGPTGTGDGPAAGYLNRAPTNLQAAHVQAQPHHVLYSTVTDGLAVMPPFAGLLSAEERWAVVYYLKGEVRPHPFP